MKKILIITDGKAGHENQSKAFCEALGCGYDLLRVAYRSHTWKALSYVADRLGILSPALFKAESAGKNYDGVVCTGSTAFYPGKVTASRLGVPVCAILYPRGYRNSFDCILAPAFDNPPRRNNIIPLPVNLTAVNQDFYERGIADFLTEHTPRKKAAAVIIGGPNPFAEMNTDTMKRHIDAVFAATADNEHWVTTSRRTPPEVENLIDSYDFDYKVIYSRNKFNPIPAFVSLCDRIFVTADSTGMISEAVTHGKARVEILMNLNRPRSKFARFIENLVQEGCAHIFEGSTGDAGAKVDVTGAVERAGEMLFSSMR
ncbi:MAG: ELM1/GtrOC1 family putative glycosyltransferase [Kiritimatiellia bacterium]